MAGAVSTTYSYCFLNVTPSTYVLRFMKFDSLTSGCLVWERQRCTTPKEWREPLSKYQWLDFCILCYLSQNHLVIPELVETGLDINY